jgi:hypothetical protein
MVGELAAFELRPLSHFAALLLDPSDIAEFNMCSWFCLSPCHGAIHQVVSLLVQMLTDRLGKLVEATATDK